MDGETFGVESVVSGRHAFGTTRSPDSLDSVLTRLDDADALERLRQQPRMTERYADATAVIGDAGALWSALASDDDRAVTEILAPQFGLRLSWLPSGLAERLRATFQLTEAECETDSPQQFG